MHKLDHFGILIFYLIIRRNIIQVSCLVLLVILLSCLVVFLANGLALNSRELVERTKNEAKWDGIIVPTTLEEYCSSSRQQQILAKTHQDNEASMFLDDDDDFCFCAEDDEEFDDPDDIYEEAKDLEDEGVACNHVPDIKTSNSAPSAKPSVESSVPSTSSRS